MMMGMAWARPYFEASLLLLPACVALGAISRSKRIPPAWSSSFGRILALSAVSLPGLALLIPRESLLRPAVRVASGSIRNASSRELVLSLPALPSWNPLASTATSTEVTLTHGLLFGVLATLALFGLHRIFLRIRAVLGLYRRLSKMPVVRRWGRVTIVVSDEDPVPFALWSPSRRWVVMPSSLLPHAEDWRLAIRHELQHHRQGDTLWAHLIETGADLFFWNPAARVFAKQMSRVQEFACDEALMGRQCVSPLAYAGCLFRVAQSAVGSRSVLVGTTGMASSASGHILKRRVEMLLNRNGQRKSYSAASFAVIALGTVLLMGSAAFASRSAIQDRAFSLAEAQALAAKSNGTGEIPVFVNDLVLAQLNRYVGTPDGRSWVKRSLARMPRYREMIEKHMVEYVVPLDLMAMPLIESGFSNDVVSPAPSRAAGIWQFIPQTARNYGLLVDGTVDERLEPVKETVAAMQLLTDHHAEFKNWLLAMKAYNEGGNRVRTLIEMHGTRDPWVLERISSAESYLAKIMAGILILRNPSLVD